MKVYVHLHTLDRSIYAAERGCTVSMSARKSAAPVARPRAATKKNVECAASACAVARYVAPWSTDTI